MLRIAREWEAAWIEKGFRTPPSRIALFEAHVTSRLVFTRGAGTAEETLSIIESFKLTDGSAYECRSGAKVAVTARYGDHAGETAVELTRPPLRLTRACNAEGFPEPTISLDTPTARFALRGDRLVPLSPPKERREYLPAS